MTSRISVSSRVLRRAVPQLAIALIALPLIFVHPNGEPMRTTDGSVTMGHEEFSKSVVTVHVGDSIVLRNTSHWLHAIVPGSDAKTDEQSGLPNLGDKDSHLSERGDVFRYGPFGSPGTYHLTCSLHPEMNLTVHVLSRGARIDSTGGR